MSSIQPEVTIDQSPSPEFEANTARVTMKKPFEVEMGEVKRILFNESVGGLSSMLRQMSTPRHLGPKRLPTPY